MTQVVDDALVSRPRGRRSRCLARGLRPPEASAAATLSPEDLEALAEAAYWLGKLDEAIGLREQAHATFLSRSRRAAQGRHGRARRLGRLLHEGRLRRLAAAGSERQHACSRVSTESIEHGYLAVSEAMNALVTGDIDEAIARPSDARDLATRFESRDLQALALVIQGRALVLQGDATEGLALLDEATAAAVSGELRPLLDRLHLLRHHHLVQRRSATIAAPASGRRRRSRWCDRSDIKGFPGACRVHQATVKRLPGDWPEAEEQALQACEETQGFDAWTTVGGLLRDRRDPPAARRLRRRRGVLPAGEGVGPRPAARARTAPPRAGQGRRRLVRDQALAGDRTDDPISRDPAPARAGRDRARGRRPRRPRARRRPSSRS